MPVWSWRLRRVSRLNAKTGIVLDLPKEGEEGKE